MADKDSALSATAIVAIVAVSLTIVALFFLSRQQAGQLSGPVQVTQNPDGSIVVSPAPAPAMVRRF
jgi:hypothetical protein